MKVLTTLVLGLALICITATAQANVLTNPGFETGDLTGWNDWAAGDSVVVTDPVHSGTYALEAILNGGETAGGKIQNLWGSLTWEDPIYGNVWIKTSNLADQDALLRVEFRGSGWEDYGSLESSYITGTTDWTQVGISGSVPTEEAAPNLDKIQFILKLSGEKTAGNAYFDDAYADTTPVPEPSTLMLLAGGLAGLFTVVRKKR